MINAAQAQAALKNADKLYSRRQVDAALKQMAAEMAKDLANTDPIILCVMNGGVIPTAALLTLWDFPLQFDYIHVSRYRDQTQGGDLNWISRPRLDLHGRVVVIVDDILDEGITMAAIVQECQDVGAKGVYSAVLLEKKRTRTVTIDADYKALCVEDRYVFGYGMDYSGYLRNAPGIYALKG